MKGADVLKVVDKVINAVQEHGVSEEELQQAKVNFRSQFLENLEGGIIPGFGRADLLAALALYDDNPGRINTIFAVGSTLFVMTLMLNIVSYWFVRRYREKY